MREVQASLDERLEWLFEEIAGNTTSCRPDWTSEEHVNQPADAADNPHASHDHRAASPRNSTNANS